MNLTRPSDLRGLRVTVMGLGLHGGGVAAARYLASPGAELTVTDLRTEDVLAPSLAQIEDLRYHAVFGRHDEADFTAADLVIKNPGVPRSSRFLRLAALVETDISLFLRFARNPLVAVTGSKGKSTVASAIHHGLRRRHPRSRLGGNITTSPLVFLDELHGDEPVVLELSSFQLGDLELTGARPALDPEVAVLTNIMHDHLDYYDSVEDYIDDKSVLFATQRPEHAALYFYDDEALRERLSRNPGTPYWFSASPLPRDRDGAFLDGNSFRLQRDGERITPGNLGDAAEPSRRPETGLLPINRVIAALALWLFGVPHDELLESLSGFEGIEHRLEPVGTLGEVRFVNDSAATIPPAVVAAIEALQRPVRLIAGGADKELDLEPFVTIAERVAGLYLLAGSATDRLVAVLQEHRLPYHGPFNDLPRCLHAAADAAEPGDAVLLSPGCASFGMFLNEFDRGRQFKRAVHELVARRTESAAAPKKGDTFETSDRTSVNEPDERQ